MNSLADILATLKEHEGHVIVVSGPGGTRQEFLFSVDVIRDRIERRVQFHDNVEILTGRDDLLVSYGAFVIQRVNNSHQGFVRGTGMHQGKCLKCGTEFDNGIRPDMTLCHSCWYSGEMKDASKDFHKLAIVIESTGMRTEVLQTGGMVMCLAAYPTEAALPYFMWGDPSEFGQEEDEGASFSVYIQDEDTEQDLMVLVDGYAQLPAALSRWQEWVVRAIDPNQQEATA